MFVCMRVCASVRYEYEPDPEPGITSRPAPGITN